MLENIRKYTGLFIVVLVLIFIGLIFIESDLGRGGPGSGPVLVKTNDRAYSAKEYRKAGQKIQIAERLMQTALQNGSFAGYSDIVGFLGTMEANSNDDDAFKRYLVHRDHFEKAKKQFGLAASKDEIDLYQRENVFTGRDGIFNDEAYTDFKEKGLKGAGTLNDVDDFVGDVLAYKALTQVLGAGVITDEKAAQEKFIAERQQFTLSTLSLDIETFKKEIEPTDEEIKTYWEENQGRYLTEAKRRLTYFTAAPDFEKALADKKKKEAEREKTPAEQAEESEKTPEEIAAAAKAKQDALVLSPQDRKKVIDELGLVIDDDILVSLEQKIEGGAKTADLEGVAKEFGYETKSTELLPLSELPAEIRGPIRGLRSTVEQELAKMVPSEDNLLDALSETFGVGTDNWLLFRVDEAIEPVEKTFEEAKEDALADYVQEKAEEALQAGIDAAHEAVVKAVADGTPLNEAAAAQNLKLTEHLGMSANDKLPGEPNANDVFRLASQTPTGEISNAEVMEPFKSRALFVSVKEREFVESDQNKNGLKQAAAGAQYQLRQALVQHWFDAEYEKANVEIVNNK